jgi:hypothetical protein
MMCAISFARGKRSRRLAAAVKYIAIDFVLCVDEAAMIKVNNSLARKDDPYLTLNGS